MFLGHYAVAMAAKRVAPGASLGTLLAAAVLLDLIWPVLVIAGLERVIVEPGVTAFTPLNFQYYPISHSLLMSAIWGVMTGGACFFYSRSPRTALVVGGLVVSHWVLDVTVHRPDLPLIPGSPLVLGLGLWNSIALTLAVELGMFAIGMAVYVHTTRALDRIGGLGLTLFVIFLVVTYAGAAFGPPPPSAAAVAWSDMGQWLLILWAAWLDKHRASRWNSAPRVFIG